MTQPLTVADLAFYVLRQAKALPAETRFVLGVSGPPGSGKSTLASLIIESINTNAGFHVAQPAPMDGFHLSNAKLTEEGKLDRKGAPDTFDVAEFAQRLSLARTSETVPWPTYSRQTHEPSPDGIHISVDTRIIVTEGNYLLLDDRESWASVRPLLNEAWYLDVPMETVSERLIERHILGGKSKEQAQSKTRNSDLPNAILVSKSRDRADRVLTELGDWFYAASPPLAA